MAVSGASHGLVPVALFSKMTDTCHDRRSTNKAVSNHRVARIMPKMLGRLRTANTLQISHRRASAVFFIGKSTLRCSLEQGEFLLQRRLTCFGQYTQQMLEQDMEPARHLHAAGAVMANFRDGQADKIDPVWRPVAQAQPAMGVERLAGIEAALADVHQEPVNLI